MNQETGNISVNTENIFPIIKRWLYSDKDIFAREMISNGCDAISKLKRLMAIREADVAQDTAFFVKVILNKEKKTLSFVDNGIGMTAEEVKKYINQVAFSGAEEFIARYQGQSDEAGQIIGHFGLGFYSAFMVADRVQIDTLSYQKDAVAVSWVCDGGTEYQMGPSDRKERGTSVTLYIADDSSEFLDQGKLREVIEKYCAFLPVEIFLEDISDQEKEKKEEPKPLNETNPLWMRDPKDCTEQDYKDFYTKVFFDFREPLFWIHLNVDYPFNLKGILYFPKINHEFDRLEGKIKLYNNQVFVADNIKEVIPEFLMLLKGVIDCTDLPLNVSRSFLQKDANVVKISRHITKKVADKLTELYNGEREKYQRYWDDINPFVKYGCIREEKFYDRVKDIIVYKTISGDYLTLQEYLVKTKDKHENKVFYVTDEKQQAQYVELFKAQGLEAVLLPAVIDLHFVQFMESKEQDVKFARIDSDLSESLKNSPEGTEEGNIQDRLEKIFRKALNNENLKVQVENLKSVELPAMILLAEESRRWHDLSASFSGPEMKEMFPREETLVLNRNNDLIRRISALDLVPDREKDARIICEQVYDLAQMSHRQLEPEAMTRFLQRSNQILAMVAGIKTE